MGLFGSYKAATDIHELGTKYTEIVYNIHINGNMMVIAVYIHIVTNKYCHAY